jgi:hypothetical protein
MFAWLYRFLGIDVRRRGLCDPIALLQWPPPDAQGPSGKPINILRPVSTDTAFLSCLGAPAGITYR